MFVVVALWDFEQGALGYPGLVRIGDEGVVIGTRDGHVPLVGRHPPMVGAVVRDSLERTRQGMPLGFGKLIGRGRQERASGIVVGQPAYAPALGGFLLSSDVSHDEATTD